MEMLKTILIASALIPFLIETAVLILSARYKKIAINLNKSQNETFRAIKLRYVNSAKLGIPIKNARGLICKSLFGKSAPLSRLLAVDRFGCLIACFNLVCAVLFIIKNHMEIAYIITLMTFCFYIFRQACAIEYRTELITMLTEDYLENTLSHRVNPAYEEKAKQRKTTDSAEKKTSPIPSSAEPAIEEKETATQTSAPSTNMNNIFKKENSDIIEAVLQEFLA